MSFAQIFYKALEQASRCKLLREICADILEDESQHIVFQLDRLCQLNNNRSYPVRKITIAAYWLLFYGILFTIWIAHGRAFTAGGFHFTRYFNKSRNKFKAICKRLNRVHSSPPFHFSKPVLNHAIQ